MQIIVSKKNKVLVVPRIPAVVNLFPDAPVFDTDRVIVQHNMHSYKLLKHIGFNAPHPILTYYDWAGGDPFQVQKATCAMLTENPRAYVLNALGCGKTASALWAWDFLYENKLCGKLLVDAPLSTLHFVWAAEVLRRLPHRRVAVLHGSKKKRLEKLNEDADIYVINHDGLSTIAEHIVARTDIDALCLDELAVFRNQSDRSKLMRKFAARFKTVWGMTGKPMPNAPTDVWAQCKIVTPQTVTNYFNQTREILMTPAPNQMHKWLPKADAVEKAKLMMRPAVRYTLDDVTELPDVVYPDPIDVGMSVEQKDTYVKLAKQLKVMFASGTVTAVNAGVAMGKLLQIASGWVYTTNPAYVGLNPYSRINHLLELIENAPEKVLVFVPYRHAAHELSKAMSAQVDADNPNGAEHFVVHGDVTPTERDRIFNAFQNDPASPRVILAHPTCCCHGLTLTAASTIVWYAPITSNDIYEQANARIRRIGQKNRQQIFRLQASAVERKVYAMLAEQQKIQDKFLELLEEATGPLP
jgi:SNF2 family DNA or RNA helicase